MTVQAIHIHRQCSMAMSCCWDSQTVGMRSLLHQICGVQNLWTDVKLPSEVLPALAPRLGLEDTASGKRTLAYTWNNSAGYNPPMTQKSTAHSPTAGFESQTTSDVQILKILHFPPQAFASICTSEQYHCCSHINASVKLACSIGMPVDISRHCMLVPSFLIEVADWAKSGEILYLQLFSLHVHEQT